MYNIKFTVTVFKDENVDRFT